MREFQKARLRSKMDKEKLLGLIWSSEPIDFSSLCEALRDAGMYPESKPEWGKVFRALDDLASDGLIEIEKLGGKFSAAQLTHAGADRVRGALDAQRPLLR
jgi:hypothetical protein